jgi:hypothetical protein
MPDSDSLPPSPTPNRPRWLRVVWLVGSGLSIMVLASWFMADRLFTIGSGRTTNSTLNSAINPAISPAIGSPIAPAPQLPTITLQIDGKTPQAKYLVPLTRQPQLLTVTWAVSGPAVQVEILPAPGKVAAQGGLTYQMGPQAATATLTIKATNTTGQAVSQSVVIETFDPTGASAPSRDRPVVLAPAPAPLPTSVSRSPHAPTTKGAQPPRSRDSHRPTPIAPDRLSPLETAPQFSP